MKCTSAWNRAIFDTFALSTALCLITVGRLSAQTTAAPAAKPAADEEAIVLSPFVVEASEDAGYSAVSTLAGTRVRTDLKDVASAISVVTTQFLKDTGAKNSADLLIYTPSTEVAGVRGNFSGVAGNAIYQENTISTTTRVRGLTSADNTRNYFLSDIPWDGYNVGRVDLQRGPNSILFGTGSPAGIINTSLNDASFKTAYNVEDRIDQYGSVRNSIDLNQVLVKGVLAFRLAVLKDNELFEQQPAYNNTTRVYAAMRFDPKLFGEDNHTSIRMNYEDGKVVSNNPRSIPPTDDVSLWFKTGVDAYGHYGYNHFVINQFNTSSPTPWGSAAGNAYPSTLPGQKGSALWNGLSLANATRTYWTDIFNYFEGTPQARNSTPNSPVPSGTPLKTIVAQPNIAWSLSTGGNLSDAGINPNYLPGAIPMASVYYRDVGNLNAGSSVPGSSTPIPGGGYYANTVLTDKSFFNFYKLLLDGPNKQEWQNWKAFNFAIDQSFFNGRLNFELSYDHQDFRAGAYQWMTGENYNINIDINVTYADGTPNPNVGRPYAGNGASAPGLNYENHNIRDSWRFTPTFELRPEDFLGKTTLSKILGKQNFTGLLDRYNVRQDYVNWAEYATTAQYTVDANLPTTLNSANKLNAERSFEWIDYLGGYLGGAASPAGAHLSNIKTIIAPPAQQQAIIYNSHWNKPTNTNDPAYVDPSAPWTYLGWGTGTVTNGTQKDNPANYVGWQQQTVNWLNAHNPADYPDLVEAANRSRFRDTSTGLTWQGYMFGGDLVPTVGWRKDVITAYQTNAYTNPLSGYTSLDYRDDPSSRTDVTGESKSWGVVYHLPKSVTSKLPWDSTISVFYNHGKNFKADATRLTLAGTPVPNSNGDTKEYGFTITTLQDKLSLKVDWFKTLVTNATLADTQGNSIGGLGNNAYFIANGSQWGYAWATDVQEGNAGNINGSNIWDYAAADNLPKTTPAEIAAYNSYNVNGGTFTDTNGTTHHTPGATAIVAAWLKAPFPSTFFSSYHQTPGIDPTIAYRTGRLLDGYVGGIPGGINGGVPQGGGSSFGNHQTTVDNLSKGTEVELTYQPVKNWNILLNYTHNSATNLKIDAVSGAFIGALTKFYNGPGGQVREWYNGGGTLKDGWNSSIVAPYAVLQNELGHSSSEVSPWRLNLISNYTIDHGMLKDVFFGGALRIEAGRIIGYQYDKTFVNSISTDPNYADVVSLTLGGLNVNKPYIGENEKHVDAWIGYNRKLTNKVKWRIQLNLKSVGENDRLVASRMQPNGDLALARIVQGMGYQLTNSFDF